MIFVRVLVPVAVVALSLAVPASAQQFIGKSTSMVRSSTSAVPGISQQTYLSTTVPKSYKSASRLLSVSTTLYVNCGTGVALYTRLLVNNVEVPTYATEEDGSGGLHFTSRRYVSVPESAGGPNFPKESSVELRIAASAASGCNVYEGVMVVEALK